MITRRPILMSGALLALGANSAVAAQPTAAGVWTAILVSRGRPLRLRLTLGADGAAVVESLDQNVKLPARAEVSGDRVGLVLAAAGVRFDGRLSADGRLNGIWRQGPIQTPLTWLRGEAGFAQPVAAIPARAASPKLTQLGLEALLRQSGAPALAAAAQRRRAPPQFWAGGLRRAGAAAEVTVSDRWHIGSITKSMVATVAARLVDAGRLSWDDTLGAALGGAHPAMLPAYRQATLRHLLSHRAGLPRDLSVAEMQAVVTSGADVAGQTHAVLELAFAIPPTAALGAQMSYSNIDYMAVGAILRARTGQDWETLMRRELFAPLGLKSAGFSTPDSGPDGLAQPTGHGEWLGQPYRAYPSNAPGSDLPPVWGPSGTVHMGLADLLTYLAAHRDRSRLLKAATWQVLHRPPYGGDYALGWAVRPDGSLFHSGSNLRWYAEVTVDPAHGVVAAAVMNDGRLALNTTVTEALEQAAMAVRAG